LGSRYREEKVRIRWCKLIGIDHRVIISRSAVSAPFLLADDSNSRRVIGRASRRPGWLIPVYTAKVKPIILFQRKFEAPFQQKLLIGERCYGWYTHTRPNRIEGG